MVLSYLNELDLSQTHFDDNWKSKKLSENPAYTEDIQAIDRWFHRRIELYKQQAYNEVIQERNERERRRRNKVRKALKELMEETLGNDIPTTMSDDYPKYAYSEAPMPPAINKDFNEDWMDEDLKNRGLYHPCMELLKQWLKLTITASQALKCDELREQLISEETLSAILSQKEMNEIDLDTLCDDSEDKAL